MQQNTEQWLNFRKDKVGASDAAIIMGISPWKTAYQLWEEKLGLSSGQTENFAMKRGKALEPEARALFEKMAGIDVFPEVRIHPKHSWMMASLDGVSLEGDIAVEIKCAGKKDHDIAKNGKIPDKYFPQVQHQMEVLGLNQMLYFSFREGEGVIVKVAFDAEYVKGMILEEQAFMECLYNLETPKLSDRDFCKKSDDIWAHAAAEWQETNKQMKELAKKEKELRNTLIQCAAKKNAIGSGVRLTRTLRKGNIDYTQIPELKNVDLESYRKAPVEAWRVTPISPG